MVLVKKTHDPARSQMSWQRAKRCPFCGGKAYEAGRGVGGPGNEHTWQFWLSCHDCWAAGPKAGTRDGSYALWDSRPAQGTPTQDAAEPQP